VLLVLAYGCFVAILPGVAVTFVWIYRPEELRPSLRRVLFVPLVLTVVSAWLFLSIGLGSCGDAGTGHDNLCAWFEAGGQYLFLIGFPVAAFIAAVPRIFNHRALFAVLSLAVAVALATSPLWTPAN
jgi:hypothetical protein